MAPSVRLPVFRFNTHCQADWATAPGGNLGSQTYPGGYAASFDDTYKDYDGTKAIRILNPCTGSAASFGQNCQWFDNATQLSMQEARWYSTAESLGDGSIVLIGGMSNGG
jgi:hypothetical protein